MTWDHRFMKQAELWAGFSKDLSTRVGCAIIGPDREVLSIGYNGLPRGVDDLPERYERPLKNHMVIHAEQNAIYNAARIGVRLKGGTAYVTLPPCGPCAGGLIQVGVIEIIVLHADDDRLQRWAESFEAANIMLDEAGVPISYLGELEE